MTYAKREEELNKARAQLAQAYAALGECALHLAMWQARHGDAMKAADQLKATYDKLATESAPPPTGPMSQGDGDA